MRGAVSVAMVYLNFDVGGGGGAGAGGAGGANLGPRARVGGGTGRRGAGGAAAAAAAAAEAAAKAAEEEARQQVGAVLRWVFWARVGYAHQVRWERAGFFGLQSIPSHVVGASFELGSPLHLATAF